MSGGHEDDFEDVATVTFEGGGNKRVSRARRRDVRIRIDRRPGPTPSVATTALVATPVAVATWLPSYGIASTRAPPYTDRAHHLQHAGPNRDQAVVDDDDDEPAGAVHGARGPPPHVLSVSERRHPRIDDHEDEADQVEDGGMMQRIAQHFSLRRLLVALDGPLQMTSRFRDPRIRPHMNLLLEHEASGLMVVLLLPAQTQHNPSSNPGGNHVSRGLPLRPCFAGTLSRPGRKLVERRGGGQLRHEVLDSSRRSRLSRRRRAPRPLIFSRTAAFVEDSRAAAAATTRGPP